MNFINMAERVLNGVGDPETLRRLRKDFRGLEAAQTPKGRQVLEGISNKIIRLDPNCLEAKLSNIPILRNLFK
jgi:hypothetical protein